jgi:small subunit ribosomal protein S18
MAFVNKSAVRPELKNSSVDGQVRFGGKFRKRGPVRKKVCRFCADKLEINYKNLSLLRVFVTESGKILSGRLTGTCAKHQRKLDTSVKRARMLALLPFTGN